MAAIDLVAERYAAAIDERDEARRIADKLADGLHDLAELIQRLIIERKPPAPVDYVFVKRMAELVNAYENRGWRADGNGTDVT